MLYAVKFEKAKRRKDIDEYRKQINYLMPLLKHYAFQPDPDSRCPEDYTIEIETLVELNDLIWNLPGGANSVRVTDSSIIFEDYEIDEEED
jgi:hypothetical protein